MRKITFSDEELLSLKEYYTHQLNVAELKVIEIQNILEKIEGRNKIERGNTRKSSTANNRSQIKRGRVPKEENGSKEQLSVSKSKGAISIKTLLTDYGIDIKSANM